MGVVYKAFHPQLKRTVALKVLIAGEDASEESIARFHREAEAVAKLGHHPNIVPVYDIGQVTREPLVGAQHVAPLHYFAMHYVDGQSLDRFIDAEKITPKRAAIITKKLAEALEHAHDHGILHRDIKPANILMAREGEVSSVECGVSSPETDTKHSTPNTKHSSDIDLAPMLTDFGLAKDVEAESSMTRSGMTLGTPHYMPPEQAEGRVADIDGRSDVYSLGATFYEMMALRPPFEGSAVVDVIQQVVLKDPVSPRRGNPAVDRDLETICLKCLAKEPEKRYGSARELTADLSRFLEGRPILARPVSAWEKFVRRVRRNRAVSLALAVLVLVLVAGGIVAWIAAGRLSTAREDKEAERRAREVERRAKEEAEKGSREAAMLLEKGRKVTGVLVSANYPLFAERKAEIDRFVESTASDPVSRATALAVQGWLYWLGAAEEEALSLLEEAQALDEDVPWGFLFEGMVRVYRYIEGVNLPPVYEMGSEIHVQPPRPEADDVRRDRERLQALIEKAAAARVWGESASQEFRQLLTGLEGIYEGDHEKAEAGLSEALEADELVWMRPELLYARAKVRYFRARFEGGREDIEDVLKAYPEQEAVRTTKAIFLTALGSKAMATGKDPWPLLLGAKEAIEWSLRRNPTLTFNHSALGTVLRFLAKASIERGEDPVPYFRGAVEAYETAVRGAPRFRSTMRNSLGVVRLSWHRHCLAKGNDPRDLLRLAVADFTAASAGSPPDVQAVSNLGDAHGLLAELHRRRGRDAEAEAAFEKGIEYHGRAIRAASPDRFHYYVYRANLYRSWGRFLDSRGRDPRPKFRKAVEDGEEAVRRRPTDWWAHHCLAQGLHSLGVARGKRDGDAIGTFRRSVASCLEALKRSPDRAELHHTLGNSLRCLGQAKQYGGKDPRGEYARAIEAYDEALRLKPGDATVYNGLATTHWVLGQAEESRGGSRDVHFERALSAFDRLIEKDPRTWQALANKGLILVEVGRFEEAVEAYKKALAVVGEGQPVLKKYLAHAEAGAQTSWLEMMAKGHASMKKNDYNVARIYFILGLVAFEKKGDRNDPKAKNGLMGAHYNLACIYALLSEGRLKPDAPPRELPGEERKAWQEKALKQLRKFLELSPADLHYVRKDSDFDPLRELPEFKALLAEFEK
jgi:tetratricopeptide (TPR) repeat protein